MIKEKLKQILSLNGILIGIIGGTFGIFSIFINWNTNISIKWIAATIIIFSFLLLICLILLFEIYKSKSSETTRSNTVIKFLEANSLLLVENNNNLEFSQAVSIFFTINNFQIPLAKGFVENIQENFVQVKIIEFDQSFIRHHEENYNKIINNNKNILKLIIIKNYIRYND